MHDHETGAVFEDSLPLARADGNLGAKTGILHWAQVLCGYLTSEAGEPLTFSIILNRDIPAQGDPSGTEKVDAIARMLAELSVSSAPAKEVKTGRVTPSF